MAAAPSWHRVSLPSAAVPGWPAGWRRPRPRRAQSGCARRTGTGCGPARGADLVLAGIVVDGRQPGGADHHAGDAVSALRGLPVDDRLRGRVRPPGYAQSLNRRYVPILNRPHRRVAGVGRAAVDEHEAGAAQAKTAAEAGARQPEWIRNTYSSAVSRSVRTSSRWPFTSTVTRMGSVSGIILSQPR